MGDTLINYATQDGLWAVLFVTLYLYQLRESKRLQVEAKEREDRLTLFINDITKQFELLVKQYERIANDVQEIRIEVHKARGN